MDWRCAVGWFARSAQDDQPSTCNAADPMSAIDSAALRAMAEEWTRVQHRQIEELRLTWVPAMQGMSASKRALSRSGQWVSGPSSIMSVLGLSRAEVVNCRMVRWLFDPLARHGLGVDMIRSLADHLDFTVDAPELAVVSVEVADGDTRADVILSIGPRIIVIEAKIDAGEQPNQAARIEAHWPDADPLIFLTPGQRRIPLTAEDPARWNWMSWGWLADTATDHLAHTPDAADERTTTSRNAVRAWAYSVQRSLR